MNIVVYCSAQENLPDKYQQLATRLGQWIGHHGHTLVYGGVNAGLMKILSTATHEAGGQITGVIPEMFISRIDAMCDTVVKTRDLAERKQYMIEQGDIFIILPGGIGTLDEWISTLCIMCIGDDDLRPVIAANLDGMFDATISQLENLKLSPFGRGKDLSRTLIASSDDELLQLLDKLSH